MKHKSLFAAAPAVLFAVLASASSAAHADEVCDRLSGDFPVKFHGQTMLAAHETYQLTLHFSPGKKRFQYDSNWGYDNHFDFDADNYEITNKVNGIFGSLWPNIDRVSAATDPAGFMDGRYTEYYARAAASRVMEALSVARDNMIAAQMSDQSRTALGCALDRVRAAVQYVRNNYLLAQNQKIQGELDVKLVKPGEAKPQPAPPASQDNGPTPPAR